ncbi:NAD(P)H-quinone oxidoreductase [Rhodobacteraceae bacterium]|nr:NAD(P)H-quinone oxidoreductase [Paracoccaceae bacterium]
MTALPQSMRAITIREPGGPEVLQMAELPIPKIAPHQVLVKVTAAGVNGPDLLQRRGHYPPPPGASELVGLEISGEVIAIGADCQRWNVGDSLCALTNGGGYAEYVAIDGNHCIALPKGVSEIDAAGLPETFFTVYSNIFHGHDVPEGANLLIHGGAGGIGSTAVQLGAAMGLNMMATVSSAESAAFVTELGAARAINYKEDDFVEVVRDAGGADIILDIVGGDYIARNMKAARHDARIIQLAFNKGSKVEVNLMPIMLKRLTLTGSTLRSRPPEFKAAVAAGVESNVWPLIASGKIKSVTHTTFPMAEATKAHEMMEASAHRGKIILTMA